MLEREHKSTKKTEKGNKRKKNQPRRKHQCQQQEDQRGRPAAQKVVVDLKATGPKKNWYGGEGSETICPMSQVHLPRLRVQVARGKKLTNAKIKKKKKREKKKKKKKKKIKKKEKKKNKNSRER